MRLDNYLRSHKVTKNDNKVLRGKKDSQDLREHKLPLHPGCASLPTGEQAPAGFNLDYPGLLPSTLEPNFNGVACPPQSTVLGPIFLDSSAPALIGLKVL